MKKHIKPSIYRIAFFSNCNICYFIHLISKYISASLHQSLFLSITSMYYVFIDDIYNKYRFF